jgi:hypothetical protein
MAVGEEQAGDDSSTSPFWMVVAWGIVAAGLYGAYKAGQTLWPDRIPTPKNPNYVDNIFASRLVVFMARVGLVFAWLVLAMAACFIALSVTVRIKRGEWLSRAGPFEAQVQPVEDLSEALHAADDTNLELARNLSNRSAQLSSYSARLREARAEVEHLQAENARLRNPDG